MESLLTSWTPPDDAACEDDFTDDLAEFLSEHSDREIKVRSPSACGTPDILVDDVLAIELKYKFKKTEADRCVGQCAGFAAVWATWIVVIDFTDDQSDRLRTHLDRSGLDHLPMFPFSMEEDEDEGDSDGDDEDDEDGDDEDEDDDGDEEEEDDENDDEEEDDEEEDDEEEDDN